MKCLNGNCDGKINLEKEIKLKNTKYSTVQVYPCSKCGRLHFKNGSPVICKTIIDFDERKRPIFALGKGKVFYLNGKIIKKGG